MHSSGETVTYGYDANGSLVTKHVDGVLVEQYEYNVEGRLVKATVHGGQNGLPVVTVTKYVYNIHGMKVAEEVSVSIDGGDPAVAKKSFVVDAQNPTGFAQVLGGAQRDGRVAADLHLGSRRNCPSRSRRRRDELPLFWLRRPDVHSNPH